MLADMAKQNGLANVQVTQCRGPASLPPKVPSPALYSNSDYSVENSKQVNLPRPCSTDVLTDEEIPSWFEDLLNEPESPANKGHRRSASDPFAYLAASSNTKGLWLRDIMERPNWSSQMPQGPNYVHGMSQLSSIRKPNNSQGLQGKMPVTSTNSPPLQNGTKEDAETSASEAQTQVDATENSSGAGELKPPAHKPDVKRKQHNARRSRVRKLQYIAELERNAHALQLEGAEVSAQLEFFDQQNLILAMENRALKQRLDNLSQEHFIKSMEQELLDRELARLQYMYHVQNMNHHQQRQRQKQAAAHRRGRSCDIDSQFSKLHIHPPEAVAHSNGFKEAQRN